MYLNKIEIFKSEKHSILDHVHYLFIMDPEKTLSIEMNPEGTIHVNVFNDNIPEIISTLEGLNYLITEIDTT